MRRTLVTFGISILLVTLAYSGGLHRLVKGMQADLTASVAPIPAVATEPLILVDTEGSIAEGGTVTSAATSGSCLSLPTLTSPHYTLVGGSLCDPPR